MGKNFLITGYGRSGTKFLSSIMDRSKQWTVLHEPRGVSDEKFGRLNDKRYLNRISSDFTDYYGEVNSYLRYYFESININKKGLLLRDPINIFISVSNRKAQNRWLNYINEISEFYNTYLRYAENMKYNIIYFEKITSDINYLNSILDKYGIDDIDVKSLNLNKKINKNRVVKYKTLHDLPKKYQNIVKNKLGKLSINYQKLLHNEK